MPAWLLHFLLGTAFKLGLPLILDLLKKRFGIGVDNKVVQVFCDYVQESRDGADKNAAKTKVKTRIRRMAADRQILGGDK